MILVGIAMSLGFGSASTAVKKVQEGIRAFSSGEFKAAGKAFAEADVAEPENLSIAFDRACALWASGDVEKARELFLQVALARDADLAARAHYNLGCLSAQLGRAALGDDPVAAPPEMRQEGISQLLSAVGHYRDCLRLDPHHADSRHNLELIRLFIKTIQAQWELQDREKARNEMGLLEFLAMIEQRQTAHRSTVRELGKEPDSPQRRQTARQTADKQAELQEEIDPLKQKITEQFQAAQQAPTGSSDPNQDSAKSKQMEQAQKLLTQLADEAGRLMTGATAMIEASQFNDAEEKQRDVLDRLNQIFMAVAPFASVLERATNQQDQLTETSEELTGVDQSAEEPDSAGEDQSTGDDSSDKTPEQASAGDDATPDADYPLLQWQQSRVTDWSRMLSLKAQSELPSVEAQLQSSQQQETQQQEAQSPSQQPETDAIQSDDNDAPTNPHADADPTAQIEALKKSLQKAIELGPKVEKHSSAATTSLGKSDSAAALPDQQQAQKLLREIAEPLAQDNQQQDNQQSDQQNNDSNDESQNQNSQQQQQKQQPDQQNQQQQDQQKHQQQTGQSPQERAMSVLRRARERERQHRDLQKQLQQMIGGRARVDRDW